MESIGQITSFSFDDGYSFAKLLYNFMFLCVLFLIIIGVMFVFTGFPVKDYGLFFMGSGLGIFGISIVFTFVSVISSSDTGSSTMMSILALPLVLPIVLLLLKITTVSVRLLVDTAIMDDVMMLIGVDFVLLGAMLLLFPGLWRS